METLNNEIVDKLSKQYLDKFFDRVKEDMLDKFYETSDMYLYEHFNNVSDKIYEEICMSIITWSKEFYGKVYRKRNDLIDVIYKDNEEDILRKISIDRLSKISADILKNKQYHWSKEWDIQKCIIEIIKNNLCEFETIWKLVDNSIVLENKKLLEENNRLLEMYNSLKSEIDNLKCY